MELLQLKYFCDAAETEKFSETAKKFLVPVSNISQSIRRLERELGIELFHHSGNKISLNKEGRRFYSYVSNALELIENARTSVCDLKAITRGELSILITTNMFSVMSTIEKFLKKYPQINLKIFHNTQKAKDVDIVVSDMYPPTHTSKMLLYESELSLAMSKTHRLTKKETVSAADLKDENFVALTTSDSLRNIMIEECMKAGFSPNFTIETYSMNFLRRYVEIGLGVSFVPEGWKDIYSDKLAFRKIEGSPKRKIYAFSIGYPRKAVTEFIEMLSDEIAIKDTI